MDPLSSMDPLSAPADDYYEDASSSSTKAPALGDEEDNVDVSAGRPPIPPSFFGCSPSVSLPLQVALRWKARKDRILKEYTTSQHIKAMPPTLKNPYRDVPPAVPVVGG